MEQPQMNPPGGAAPTPKKISPWIWVLVGCGAILVIGTILTAGIMWWGYHKAKNYVQQNLDTGQMNKVTLWSDVPPMEGMTQKNEGEMPMAIRVLARPFLDTLMRGLNDGKNAGHYDVAFYVVDGKSTADVQTFYSAKRMSENGWDPQGNCANASEVIFCSFQKKGTNLDTGLLIIAASDKESKSTSLYFLRGEMPADSTKKSS